jgi:hypothetical protein
MICLLLNRANVGRQVRHLASPAWYGSAYCLLGSCRPVSPNAASKSFQKFIQPVVGSAVVAETLRPIPVQIGAGDGKQTAPGAIGVTSLLLFGRHVGTFHAVNLERLAQHIHVPITEIDNDPTFCPPKDCWVGCHNQGSAFP